MQLKGYWNWLVETIVMNIEKNAQPAYFTQPIQSAYPDLPPPSYPGSPTYATGNGNAPDAVSTLALPRQPPVMLVSGPIVAAPSTGGFVAIPSTRYDTMTSYAEDGTAIQALFPAGAILDNPVMMPCPFCKSVITTVARPVTGCLTWLCCLGIMLSNLMYGCCLIPFCVKRLKDVEHICPKCHNIVAIYKRIWSCK